MSFIKKKVPDIHTQQLVENTERQAQKLGNEIEALLITARKDRQKVYLQKEETEPGMDKLKSIVYTIANLQDEINEKTVLTQRLLEENQKLKGELAMLKNERNIG